MSELIEKKEFDILYGKSKEGKIKYWQISVEHYQHFSEIVTIFGFKRKIETRRRINSGKNLNKSNATTHFQQAILEATSKWKKKREIEKFTPQTDTDPNDLIIPLNQLNINTNDTNFKLPMLAQDYSKHKNKVIFPCFLQPKLDGYRMIYDSTSKSITTRQGKEFSIIKQSNLLFKELSSLPENVVFDGELYIHNNSFETLGILRKTKNLTEKDKVNLNKIEYHIYDIIEPTLTFQQRYTKLKNILDTKNFQMIKCVETFIINSEDDIKENHSLLVKNGYEGSIIRNSKGLYKEKYRSFDLLKYKDFMDGEFEIMDYSFEKDTSGQDKNLILWVVKIKDDIWCRVRPKGTKEERQRLYKECVDNFKQFKGRKLWTKFFEYTNDGNLRFPTTKTDSISSYIRDEVI